MRNYPHTGGLVLAAALFAGIAAPVSAGGGVVLIGQPKNFPIVITQPGSYKLAENLTVSDAHTAAIEIATDNVTIDLDGFAILGPVVCPGASCPGSDLSDFYARGIQTTSSSSSNITVRNGTIQGMGGHGIFLGGSSRIENMHLRSNGFGGILLAGQNAIVRNNNIDQHCGTNGITIQVDGFLVSDNVVTGCGPGQGAGVTVPLGGAAGSVVRNVVSNYEFGLALSANTSYTGNVLKNVTNVFPIDGINMGQNHCDTAACPNAVY